MILGPAKKQRSTSIHPKVIQPRIEMVGSLEACARPLREQPVRFLEALSIPGHIQADLSHPSDVPSAAVAHTEPATREVA